MWSGKVKINLHSGALFCYSRNMINDVCNNAKKPPFESVWKLQVFKNGRFIQNDMFESYIRNKNKRHGEESTKIKKQYFSLFIS